MGWAAAFERSQNNKHFNERVLFMGWTTVTHYQAGKYTPALPLSQGLLHVEGHEAFSKNLKSLHVFYRQQDE